jgi:ABC transporter related protein
MRARLSAQFLEAIQGLSTLVGIGAADRVGERLARTGEDNRLAVMRVLARNQLILFVMEGVFSLFLVTAAIVVSWIRPPRQKVAKNASSERSGLHFGRILTTGSAPAS